MRVPFFVTGPGVDAGRRIGQRIYLQSVMPTTLNLAGVEVPAHVEFQNLLPLLKDGSEEVSGTVYGAYTQTQRMITSGSDKLVMYPKTGVSLLFDVGNDPLEINDRSKEEGALALKKKLFQEFLKQQQVVADPLDVTDAFPDLAG